MTVELEELKAKQRRVWGSGDYRKIAWLTVPLADTLCEAADLEAGSSVLDVATGTGHVALAAARRFCDATGVDYVPELVEAARGRAAAELLPVDFRLGDAEELPFEDDRFDYVLSAIGVMFTADHERAAAELVRVCRPGGTVGLLNWTPSGFVGRPLKTVAAHVPPPPGAVPPPRWGTQEYLESLFGDRCADLSVRPGSLTIRFRSPEHFADFFLEEYGPTRTASRTLDRAGVDALREDLAAVADQSARPVGGAIAVEWEYITAIARCR